MKTLSDLENAPITQRFGNDPPVISPFMDLLNIKMESLMEAVQDPKSIIISGPEQHNKTHVMSGATAVQRFALSVGTSRPLYLNQSY